MGDGLLARAPLVPQPRHRGGVAFDAAIGVEQSAMGRGVDEGALVVLAVDFHQRRAKRAQHLDADRLVVDESAGAAVGELHAAHDQLVFAAEIVLGQQAARRMIFAEIESGDHLALLGALAHHRGVAARAERQRESIEQDRFAGAGLARQRGEAGPKSMSRRSIRTMSRMERRASMVSDDG